MPEAKLEQQLGQPFELTAGNISLDFINTLDDRPSGNLKELLNDYCSLARFSQETGILTPQQLEDSCERARLAPDEAEAALRRARDLREALHDIFSAVMNKQAAPQSAVDTLNVNLHDAALHSRLVQAEADKPGGRLVWRFDDPAISFNALLWPIARAAADLLASDRLALVRACDSPTCQWLFLDTSKNHHRRWCSMKLCGNRTKVRRFYARQKNAH
jgi:predicted RNA-binding Zn ribbon-like protein